MSTSSWVSWDSSTFDFLGRALLSLSFGARRPKRVVCRGPSFLSLSFLVGPERRDQDMRDCLTGSLLTLSYCFHFDSAIDLVEETFTLLQNPICVGFSGKRVAIVVLSRLPGERVDF